MKKCILTGVFTVILAVSAFSQTKCDEIPDDFEFWKSVRVFPPLHVVNFDPVILEWRFETKQGIYVGSFTPTEKTFFSPEFPKEWRNKKSLWFGTYCSIDNKLIAVLKIVK